MTLYLKYRSQIVDELDIKEVRETLKKIIESGQIPHALLFLGPKGTGKTSAARILAKAVNCEKPGKDKEPCNECDSCKSISKGENLDVVEIDAASHRGIDDIRGLRDAVKLSPLSSKMKVYIIDEAHMLTTEASNALLKTLEEPPAHVMFILATTNPEKLIETIRSRTTNVVFRKATSDEITRSLNRVLKGEGVKSDIESLELIASFCEGSFRDAVKVLEQLIAGKKELTKKITEEVIFGKKEFDINKLLISLEKKDVKGAVDIIEHASSAGVPAKSMIYALSSRIKNSLLSKVGLGKDDLEGFSKEDIIQLLKLLSVASQSSLNSIIDQVALEVAVIEWCGGDNLKNVPPDSPKDGGNFSKESPKKIDVSENKKSENTDTGEDASPILNHPDVKDMLALDNEIWIRIMSQIRPINASTEALLRASHPMNYDGKILTLAVYYKFHKERLEGFPHRKILEDTLSEILGGNVRVICTLTEPPIKKIEITSSLQEQDGHIDQMKMSVSETMLGSTDTILTEAKDKDIIKVAEEIFGN